MGIQELEKRGAIGTLSVQAIEDLVGKSDYSIFAHLRIFKFKMRKRLLRRTTAHSIARAASQLQGAALRSKTSITPLDEERGRLRVRCHQPAVSLLQTATCNQTSRTSTSRGQFTRPGPSQFKAPKWLTNQVSTSLIDSLLLAVIIKPTSDWRRPQSSSFMRAGNCDRVWSENARSAIHQPTRQVVQTKVSRNLMHATE